jgi:serine/threonine protein kinase
MNEREIFSAALEKPTAAERSQYLSAACGGDSTLRQRVESLLQMHETTGEFLQIPVVDRLAEGAALEDSVGTAGDPTVCGAGRDGLGFLEPSQQPGSLGRLGHYEVQEVIGTGGMGIVVRAFDERLHRVVAIKVMATTLATCGASRKLFLREARAAAAVCHDHVVTIYAVEEAGDLPYLVMQCVAGMSLQQRLDRDGPLALHEILRIGMQTAAGLAAAHAQGLIHRDVKPANILLENSIERVKITDFGLARAATDASISQNGIVAGTPHYMSPEQARGDALDCRTDLFSLGSVLYAMCTGRAPFRATSSMAVLKRVCEETPSPIREANSEIPQWLVELIDKLHSKDPAERFQSAAEVAETLGGYLAHVQQPTNPLPPAPVQVAERRKPVVGDSRSNLRRWSIAAIAVLLILAVTLSLTEARGVTHLASTVTRIFTPEGTLVVETDDPAVKVTVEGDGGLVITGAGLEEIRLRPGSYRVYAAKDGQRVPLERELVRISRGGREVVKVKIETASAAVAGIVQKGAFVLLGGKDVTVRKFDTLAEAVLAATDGDAIEIRGNGPFITQPLVIGNIALTIRAGSTYRPRIECVNSNPTRFPGYYFFHSQGSLTLEGLEFHYALPDLVTQPRTLIGSGGSLHVANCTFRLSKPSGWTWNEGSTKECVVRNCAFYNSNLEGWKTLSGHPKAGFRGLIDNCIICGVITDFHFGAQLPHASLNISRITHIGPIALKFHVEGWPIESPRAETRWLNCDMSSNILGPGSITETYQDKLSLHDGKALDGAQVVERMQRLVAWRGEQNLYTVDPGAEKGERFRILNVAFGEGVWNDGPPDLDAWRKFWDSPETGSIVELARFQGGDLIHRANTIPEKLTPDDFRLRPDSAGYRAGKDSKDLGADVDLVGPGAAYERWKKTPEYQEWVTETGQLRVESQPEAKAFVVIGGRGVMERKFDTLAEAVSSASDDATIEIRGNGPFAIEPIEFRHPLTIRAGAGFGPVMIDTPINTEVWLWAAGPLRLEGLELRSGLTAYRILLHAEGPLAVANCRFLRQPRGVCISSHAGCNVQNCQLSSPEGAPVSIECDGDAKAVITNCLLVGHNNLEDMDVMQRATMRFTHNTFVTAAAAPTALLHIMKLPRAQATQAPAQRLSLFTSDCVFDSGKSAFDLFQPVEFKPHLAADEIEKWLPQRVEWREERNLYSPRDTLLRFSTQESRDEYRELATSRAQGLEDWNRFWGVMNTGSSQGVIRFHGGNLRAKAKAVASQLTPRDFRLHEDSAGYRAGPDGKDLGADVDLVGPGPAYERWKPTPEYQEWLKETGQDKSEGSGVGDGS